MGVGKIYVTKSKTWSITDLDNTEGHIQEEGFGVQTTISWKTKIFEPSQSVHAEMLTITQ